MARRNYTTKDTERADKMRELGCIVCYHYLNVFTPTAIHHIDGQTKEGCHQLTIPLCPNHHQIKSNVQQWCSRHGDGRAAFEEAYDSEQNLLELTNELIA